MNRSSAGIRVAMKSIAMGLIVMALGISATLLSASPLDDKIATLKKSIIQEIAEQKGKNSTPGLESYQEENLVRSTGMVDGMLANLANSNNDQNTQAALQQVLSQFSSPDVQTAGNAVLTEMRSEQDAKTAAYSASVDALIKRVSLVVLKATKASDLDQLLIDLEKIQQTGRETYGIDQDRQRASQRALSAYQFVAGWQDYLSELATGKIQEAQNEMNSLAQNNYGELLVPRSDILDRANRLTPGTNGHGKNTMPSESVRQIALGIQSPDDLAPTLKRIEAMASTQNDPDFSSVVQSLQSLTKNYEDAKAGMTGFEFGNSVLMPQFDNPKLYAKLWIFLLEHEFNAYQGPPPVEGESPLQFLENILTDAEKRQDWHEMQQAYLPYSYLEQNSFFLINHGEYDMRDFGIMLAGLNQETAGQYAPAVLSYENALKSSNTYLPAKFIGERLSGIEKNHPKEYAEGLQLAGLAPTATPAASPDAPTSH
jgi:hypothetical protein